VCCLFDPSTGPFSLNNVGIVSAGLIVLTSALTALTWPHLAPPPDDDDDVE
jgi:hypothetical protein